MSCPPRCTASNQATKSCQGRSVDPGPFIPAFLSPLQIGFKADGRIVASQMALFNNAGNSHDLSASIMDRALLHSDACYKVAHVRVAGKLCRWVRGNLGGGGGGEGAACMCAVRVQVCMQPQAQAQWVVLAARVARASACLQTHGGCRTSGGEMWAGGSSGVGIFPTCQSRASHPCTQDAPGVQHRLPRLWRPPGEAMGGLLLPGCLPSSLQPSHRQCAPTHTLLQNDKGSALA